jgi:hypothetical protein
MPFPFPGMDPYLEHRFLWPSVHAWPIPEIGAARNELAHLVEIDLLRADPPMPLLYDGDLLPDQLARDYRFLISRSDRRPRAELLTASVRERLPVLPIPLRDGDTDVPLDMNATVRAVYSRGRYDSRVDYRIEPEPPLSPADAAWADALRWITFWAFSPGAHPIPSRSAGASLNSTPAET